MGARLTTAVVGACFVALLLAVPSAHAAFPGANGKIAYMSAVPGRFDIYSVNLDGTNPQNLTSGASTSENRAPSWSPDGQRVLFFRNRPGGSISTVNADGTGLSDPNNVSGQYPSWSPDGGSYTFSEGAIFTARLDGTDLKKLTPGDPLDFQPVWSPDGTRIAFHRENLAAHTADIYVIAADGSAEVNLTNSDSTGELKPDWSPDGRRLVFQRVGGGNVDIYAMDADGRNLTRLTTDAATDYDPVWSPDGSKIVFASNRGAHYDLWTMNADGSGQTQITDTSAIKSDPDWQPIPGPQRGDYKNAAQFCKAEEAFLGSAGFRHKYGGPKANGANAFGKCVRSN